MTDGTRGTTKQVLGYLDVGSGAAIVFLHGFTLDRTMWDEQRVALCQDYRTLAFDLPGHGTSADLSGDLSPGLEVLRCLDNAGVKRAGFIGSSLGCAVAIDIALERPSVVEALVLLDPILLGTPAANPEQAAIAELARQGNLEGARARWLDRPSFQATLHDEQAARRLRSMIARYPGGHWLGQVRDVWLHAPHTEKLPGIRHPVNVIAGARGGTRGVEMAREIARLCPHTQLEVVAEVGHLVALEAPGFLTRFLRRVLGLGSERTRSSSL
jgi:pimeloyl-ACP methyl ester carboxylesterase